MTQLEPFWHAFRAHMLMMMSSLPEGAGPEDFMPSGDEWVQVVSRCGKCTIYYNTCVSVTVYEHQAVHHNSRSLLCHSIIVVNIGEFGEGVATPNIFWNGMGFWGLHEILLYLIIYRNFRNPLNNKCRNGVSDHSGSSTPLLPSAQKSHIRETSLFPGAISNQDRNSHGLLVSFRCQAKIREGLLDLQTLHLSTVSVGQASCFSALWRACDRNTRSPAKEWTRAVQKPQKLATNNVGERRTRQSAVYLILNYSIQSPHRYAMCGAKTRKRSQIKFASVVAMNFV